MYRLLIADDEGIMLQSLREIVNTHYGDTIEVETAKSGRTAIELAESFHPDIVFMDIQMPGINGLEAIKAIRAFNSSALFYVLSAYDKFDYAKSAIALGVEKYLMKPISRKVIIETLDEAIRKVDGIRVKHSDQLKMQEKLETVIPVVENGFVTNMLMSADSQDEEHYRQLLDITEEYAYAVVVRFGTSMEEGHLQCSVSGRLKASERYGAIRAVIKSFDSSAVIGPILSDRITLIIPHPDQIFDYEERIQSIDRMRELLNRLQEQFDLKFRAGIGRICRLNDIRMSYQEAVSALENSTSRIAHTDDLVTHGYYEDQYPIDLERDLFTALNKGDQDTMRLRAEEFFDWICRKAPKDLGSMRLKSLELVLRAEHDAFLSGAVNYAYNYRKDYLDQVNALSDADAVRVWFLDHMTAITGSIRDRIEDQSESTVTRAKKYIQENFMNEISLDDVSREVNVSPYYFSKLFKEEVGENFIDYLTDLRISRAKLMLKDETLTIREAGARAGYADQNYFSRIFKKQTGMTPRQYRETEKEEE